MKTTFLQGEVPEVSYQEAQAVVLPVPYEKTTSFETGTEQGPQAVLDVSPYLELYDEELDCEPFKAGIFTQPALQFSDNLQTNFERITQTTIALLEDGKFVVAIGGEHTISFPLFQAYQQKFATFSILQLDAHADLRDQYQNHRFSHACVMRRIFEKNPHIVQLGIRALDLEERAFIREKNIKTYFAHQLHDHWSDDVFNHLHEQVYLTIDVDFFDPAVIPGTGTPEPGGFFWPETLSFLKKLFQLKNVIGVDVVELKPLSQTKHSEFTVAKLIYKLIGYKFFLKSETRKENT